MPLSTPGPDSDPLPLATLAQEGAGYFSGGVCRRGRGRRQELPWRQGDGLGHPCLPGARHGPWHPDGSRQGFQKNGPRQGGKGQVSRLVDGHTQDVVIPEQGCFPLPRLASFLRAFTEQTFTEQLLPTKNCVRPQLKGGRMKGGRRGADKRCVLTVRQTQPQTYTTDANSPQCNSVSEFLFIYF